MIPFHFDEPPPVNAGSRIVVIPAGLKSKPELLAHLARAIPLPDYFGKNWDALEECLADLKPAQGEIFLVHHDVPMTISANEQLVYLEILNAVARQPLSPLRIYFSKEDQAHIEQLLSGGSRPQSRKPAGN